MRGYLGDFSGGLSRESLIDEEVINAGREVLPLAPRLLTDKRVVSYFQNRLHDIIDEAQTSEWHPAAVKIVGLLNEREETAEWLTGHLGYRLWLPYSPEEPLTIHVEVVGQGPETLSEAATDGPGPGPQPIIVRSGDGNEGNGNGGNGNGSDGDGGGRPAAPQMITRVLRGEFPAKVSIGTPVTLIVTISEQGDETGFWSGLRPFAANSEVRLVCSAEGFEPLSDMQLTVTVPAAGDSDPQPFELVATAAGPQEIKVRAFTGSAYLGILTIEVTVNTSGRTGPAAAHSAPLSRREWQQGEVSLEIEYDKERNLYVYRWRDGTFVPDPSFRNPNQLQRTPAEIVDGLVGGLNRLARGMTGYSAKAARDWLKGQGVGLWQDFFPPALQRQFRENWNSITRLTIISKNDIIPWELLFASDEEGELGYLGEHFPISRLPERGVPPGLALPSADFVRPPRESPAAAAHEVGAISDILSAHAVDTHQATTDLDSLLGILDGASFSMLHFASHNSFSREAPFDTINLGKAGFEPGFLNKYQPRTEFRAASPLVFINACGSDQRTPVYTRLGGWADAFLNAGAGAFIGSLWEVRDSSSEAFAVEFYTAVTEGKTVGEAIAAARAKLRRSDPSDPTWLAYTLWGDPAAKVSLGGAR